MNANLVPFKDLQFGFASAEEEEAADPRLLLNAFIDEHDHRKEILHGRKYLILGPKGSGKTALGGHLNLASAKQLDLLVQALQVKDMSYTALGKVVGGEIEQQLRYPRAWSWLLMLSVIQSLDKDRYASHDSADTFARSVRALSDRGLLGTQDLASLLQKSKLSQAEVSLFGVGAAAEREIISVDPPISVVSNHLKQLICGCKSSSRHLLIIDGLDDVLLEGPQQFEALSALVTESARLNQTFRAAGAPVKIVVLCRADIFERLPGSNLNKLRQDLAIELTWFDEARAVNDSTLVRLANLRARLKYPAAKDIFYLYFPERIGERDTEEYLLLRTRYRPRDFIALLRKIQSTCEGLTVSELAVRMAVRKYSESYLLPEIRDEMELAVGKAQCNSLFTALRQFHRSWFTLAEFKAFLEADDAHFEPFSTDVMFPALYNCGAIGQQFVTRSGRRVAFRFRNHGSEFNPRDRIIIHDGLLPALQLE